MKIAIACDHAGYELKVQLLEWLKNQNHEIKDFGTNSAESCDYPDFAYSASLAVTNGECDYGIIICGSGMGMSMVCNKVKGIRAANCCTEEMAFLTRKHNDANILNLGARLIDFELALRITEIFLNTDFDGGRHAVRVDKIHKLTGC